MKTHPLVYDEWLFARIGSRFIVLTDELDLDRLENLIGSEGEVIKASRKYRVRKVGAFLIKESVGGWLGNTLKHTLRKGRYRRAWFAAHHFKAHGIGAPEPVAFIEYGRLGLVWGNLMVSMYLEEQRSVEEFLRAIIQRGAGQDTLTLFLGELAKAVNALTASGAYHEDLSGKNILTADGTQFAFIDLEAVELQGEYTEARRFKNHVQLYDSFCDQLSDRLLVPFIEAMLPDTFDLRVWMPKVRESQAKRRRRIEAIWEKEGRVKVS